MRALAQLSQLLQVDAEAVWCDTLFNLGKTLGFDRCLVAIVPKAHMTLDQAFLRSNYPVEWRSFYDRNQLAYVDPTVAHCITHATALT